jgi:integrase/recombinase XerD
MSKKQVFSKQAKESENLQIYDYKKKIRQQFDLMKRNDKISPRSIELIGKYDDTMVQNAISVTTRCKHIETLHSLCKLIDGKWEWESAAKPEIDSLVVKIMRTYADDRGQETHTTRDHKKILKIFFRWLKLGSRDFKEVGNPPELKDVRLKNVPSKIVREELITEDEKDRLLKACGDNLRDKAFIEVDFESDTRPGEILNLRLKHIKFDNYGAILQIDGKTGQRPVRLIRSAPALYAWIKNHPRKDDPTAPLWVSLGPAKKEHLDEASAIKMLKERCRQAGINKRVNLKLFRHTGATEKARFMTEAELKKRCGWSPNSKMPSVYVHLVSADVESKLFAQYGIQRKEQEKKPRAPEPCKSCGALNEPNAEICEGCTKPLTLKSAFVLDERRDSEMDEIRQDIAALKKKEMRHTETLKRQNLQAERENERLRQIIDDLKKRLEPDR